MAKQKSKTSAHTGLPLGRMAGDIRCFWERGKTWVRCSSPPATDSVLVRYRGTADDLLAAGIVTPEILRPRKKGWRKPRFDAGGHWFSVERPKHSPTIKVFRLLPIEMAKRLPGLGDIDAEYADWKAAKAEIRGRAERDRRTAKGEIPSESGSFQMRERCVGRYQRPVRWALNENVIWIDWRPMRREAAEEVRR